jgi:hypothetical protein
MVVWVFLPPPKNNAATRRECQKNLVAVVTKGIPFIQLENAGQA